MSYMNQLPEVWQQHWQTSGFKEPTKIQEKSFLPLKENKSVLGVSPTGTGKTLAYLLPLLLNVKKDSGNQLLIIAPSQELAMQITRVAQEWGKLLQLKTQVLIGGANIHRQVEKLKQKPEIVVGTPGRIFELMKMKKIKSNSLRTIVIDEVDQLLQQDELTITKQLLNYSAFNYQIVFFSATAKNVLTEAENLVNSLQVVEIKEDMQHAGTLRHYYLEVSQRKKLETLKKLTFIPNFSSIVFFNQVSNLGTAEEKLLFEQIPVIGLASDQNKQLRRLAIDQFTNKRVSLLLTTELAARGLDFQQVSYVVNMEVPLTKESYLHRAGRVGRMGEDGKIITFIDDRTKRDYKRLLQSLGYTTQELFLYNGELQTTPKLNKKVDKPKKQKPKKKG